MKKFKRAIGVLTIIGLMMMSLTGCGGKETEETKESFVSEETVQNTESEPETKPYFEEERDKIEVEVPSDVDAMRPIMSGLCKAMTGGTSYDPSDSLFYWEALYSSINGSTWVHSEISLADNGTGYMVPKNVMEEYAAAMFADGSTMPEIPSSMGGLEYIAEEESYMLYSAGGYVGNMDIVAIENIDNGYEVSVAFNTKNGNVENYTFAMSANQSGSFPCAIYGLAE